MFAGDINANQHAGSAQINFQKQWTGGIKGEEENWSKIRRFFDFDKYFFKVFKSKRAARQEKSLWLAQTQ